MPCSSRTSVAAATRALQLVFLAPEFARLVVAVLGSLRQGASKAQALAKKKKAKAGLFPIARHCLAVFVHQVPKQESAIVPCVRDLFPPAVRFSGICRISLLALGPSSDIDKWPDGRGLGALGSFGIGFAGGLVFGIGNDGTGVVFKPP